METEAKQRKTFKEFAEEDWAARRGSVPYAIAMGLTGAIGGAGFGYTLGPRAYTRLMASMGGSSRISKHIKEVVGKNKDAIKSIVNSGKFKNINGRLFPDLDPDDIAEETYKTLTNKNNMAAVAGNFAGLVGGMETGKLIGGYKGVKRHNIEKGERPITATQYALRKAVGTATGIMGSVAAGYAGGAIAKKLNAKKGYIWAARVIPAMLANESSRMAGEYAVANHIYKKTLDT